MRRTIAVLLIINFVLLISLPAAEPEAERLSAQPTFAVYASEENAEFRSSLFRVLRGKDGATRFYKAETIEAALASEAEVLVLVLPKCEMPKMERGSLDALKHRKIVCFGRGAVLLFGELGLELNNYQSVHGFARSSRVKVQKSELLGERKTEEPIQVVLDVNNGVQNADLVAPKAEEPDLVYVGIHPGGENSTVVDVIARLTDDPMYTPIARQDNCVLIGISVPPNYWTVPFKDLVRETCLALHARKLEAFSTARREVTKPGIYEFKLAEYGYTDQPPYRKFYFRFTEGKRLTAKLEYTGSDHMTLFFMGEDERRPLWTLKQSTRGESLTITKDIRREDSEKLVDRYWFLAVGNQSKAAAECTLTVTLDEF